MGATLIPTIVIVVAVVFVLLVSMIGFGGKDRFVPNAVPFGMQFNPSGGPELHVWAHTPLPAYIHVVMSNVSKKEEDGSVTTGIDIFELFPTGDGTNYGGANAKFTMRLISEAEIPELNKTMEMVPMVWRREPTIGTIEQFIYVSAAFTLGNWGVISWGIIINTLLALGIGVLLFFRERQAENDVMPVEAEAE